MKNKSQSTLTISAVALITAILIDLYLIIAYPESIELIAVASLIAIVDTYFLVDAILNKVDDIAACNIDKQNELAKVEKGLYSVAKREEVSINTALKELINLITELKEENQILRKEVLEQDLVRTKLQLKKDQDNTIKIVNSNERLAKILAQHTANTTTNNTELIELLNDMCKELERLPQGKEEHSHLRVMPNNSKAE